MSKATTRQLDFEVDKLTNSIESTATGEVFDTQVVRLYAPDIKRLPKRRWLFDWRIEVREKDREVYALTTVKDPKTIQGLISISDGEDHIFMNLLESADFNKGNSKLFAGVPGNLVAFACNRSIECNYKGAVAFESKTKLVEHYEKILSAKRITDTRMFIGEEEAKELIRRYQNTLYANGS